MAGHAALLGVSLRSLGLEISTQALWRLDESDITALKDLRRAGVDLALRLTGADSDRLASTIKQAHALHLTVIAGDVQTREQALDLAERGVSAVLGPIVGSTMTLEAMRGYLGPHEPWLERMRVESI
jgi:EAL domain-containing protein (putative c-di-GMP-specific phosphodiesterase class I)